MKRPLFVVTSLGGRETACRSRIGSRLEPVLRARGRLKPILRARRGHTLIELLTVITALAVVVGSATALMQLMMGMNGEVRERTYAIATFGRLAEQFRRDVHEARGEADIAEDRRSAEIKLPGGTAVHWRIDEQGNLCRSETGGASKDRQNTYALPRGASASLEVQKQGAARIVVLKVESSDVAGPSLSIEALAGRDARSVED